MQQLLNGVFIGSIYALFAIGFTLVFGILDRLNLAHPSVFAVSAFIGIELVADGGMSIWLALPIVLLFGAVLGLIIERLAFRPLKNRPDAHFAGLISSIALAGMFIALLQWRYGPDTRHFPAGSFPETPVQFAEHTLATNNNTWTFDWTPPATDVGDIVDHRHSEHGADVEARVQPGPIGFARPPRPDAVVAAGQHPPLARDEHGEHAVVGELAADRCPAIAVGVGEHDTLTGPGDE